MESVPIEGPITVHFRMEEGKFWEFWSNQGRVFVYGGYDIKEGTLDSLWMLDVGRI